MFWCKPNSQLPWIILMVDNSHAEWQISWLLQLQNPVHFRNYWNSLPCISALTKNFLINCVTGILPSQFYLACRSVSETGHCHFLPQFISVGYNPGNRFKHLKLKNLWKFFSFSVSSSLAGCFVSRFAHFSLKHITIHGDTIPILLSLYAPVCKLLLVLTLFGPS